MFSRAACGKAVRSLHTNTHCNEVCSVPRAIFRLLFISSSSAKLELRNTKHPMPCHYITVLGCYSQFMPQNDNRLLATGAADSKVTLVDLEAESTLHVFTNHKSRVKKLAVAEDEPHLLFSASEDGTVM